MEQLFGILIALAVAVVSILAKRGQMQDPRRRQQQWPGPVAQPPQYPRPAQVPPRAPSAPPRIPTAPPKPQPQPVRPQPRPYVDLEGVGMEGPGPNDTVETELSRFDREIESETRPQLSDLRFDLAREQLRTDLSQQQDAAEYRIVKEQASALQRSLVNRDDLARAVVLSEVLGKPKALRNRR